MPRYLPPSALFPPVECRSTNKKARQGFSLRAWLAPQIEVSQRTELWGLVVAPPGEVSCRIRIHAKKLVRLVALISTFPRRRANAVAECLIAHKVVDPKTVRAEGLGKTNFVAPNTRPDGSDNPVGRQKNRRVEINRLS